MEIDGLGSDGGRLVVLAQSGNQPVVAVPVVHLGHANEVEGLRGVHLLVQGHAVQVYAVADLDGPLPEDLPLAGEGDDGLQLSGQPLAEQLVESQLQPLGARKALKLLVVGIGGYLHHGLDARPLQAAEEPVQPRVGVHKAAGVDHLDALACAVVVDGAIANALPQARQFARAVIFNLRCPASSLHHPLPVAVGAAVVVAQVHFVPVLAEPFHLVANLLGDAAHFRESVIYQEQYLHPLCSCSFSFVSRAIHSLYHAHRFCL